MCHADDMLSQSHTDLLHLQRVKLLKLHKLTTEQYNNYTQSSNETLLTHSLGQVSVPVQRLDLQVVPALWMSLGCWWKVH